MSPRRVGPLLWIRLLSSLAPGEQLGVGGVELHHLTQRQIAPLRQGGEDGARGRVGQGAVVELLLGGGLEQTEALEGAKTSLDAGSSLVAGGLGGRGGRGRRQGGGQSDGDDDAGAGAGDELLHARSLRSRAAELLVCSSSALLARMHTCAV